MRDDGQPLETRFSNSSFFFSDVFDNIVQPSGDFLVGSVTNITETNTNSPTHFTIIKHITLYNLARTLVIYYNS